MDSIWKRIRQESNLPKHMVANKLGINEEKYDEIEKGQRELPKEYIDKMMAIKHTSKENKTEFELETAKADEFISTVNWKELEREFNYPMIKDMCKAMGIALSTYYHIRNNPSVVAPKTRVKIYNFFMDPLNKYVDKSGKKKIKYDISNSVIKFNEDGSVDVDWLLNIFGVSQVKLCEMLNIDKTCISKWKVKKQIPREETMIKLDALIREKLSECPLETFKTDTNSEESVSEIVEEHNVSEIHEEEHCELACACDTCDEDIYTTNIDMACGCIMDDKDYKIKELSEEIENLKRTIRCYEKLIERL